jgi:general secretion pathway protein G
MKTKPNRRHLNAGFTLVEIMIVIGIIAVIAGIVAANVFGESDRAKARLASTQLQTVAAKIDSYELDTGKLPDRLDDLVRQPSGARGWLGPYAREGDLRDPWNQPLDYRQPSQGGGRYDLISYGKGGKPGGESVEADIIHEG